MEARSVTSAPAPTGTIKRLQWLLLFALAFPPTMFAALAWHEYARAVDRAQQAVLQTSRIVHEHAANVFQTNEALLDRVIDLVARVKAEGLRAREQEFHATLRDITAHIPHARAITVWDAHGHPIVSSRYFPVAHAVTVTDRPFFMGKDAGIAIASINQSFDGRFDGDRTFTVSRRLTDGTGELTGVVELSLPQQYFTRFYDDISGNETDLSITLFGSDGKVIVRYPEIKEAQRYGAPGELMKAITDGSTAGNVRGLSTFDGTYRFAAFRQVAPYPIFVAVSRTSQSVLAEWRHDLFTLAIFGLPTWLALVLAILFALKKARSEHEAIGQWDHETARRTLAEDQLRQFQKYEVLGELTGGLAHDFNNLLGIVSSNAAIMSLLPRNSDMQPYLSAITRAVSSGSALTKHLLAFARKQSLTFVRIKTSDAVPAICELAKHSLPKTIELKCDVPSGVHDIIADGTELELAIINMTVNARDAMPDGGLITVRARNVPAATARMEMSGLANKDYVAISVLDTGTGIPEAVLDRVFEPFFTTKKGNGTGLGLSRVHDYVLQLGGTVTAKNCVTGGAIITLYIPSGAGPENDGSVSSGGSSNTSMAQIK